MTVAFPHRRFYEIVSTRDPDLRLRIRNRLLSTSEKELYFALYYLGEAERRSVLSLLSETKAQRVREVLLRGGRFGQEEYRLSVNHLIAHIVGERSLDPLKSYYRPRRS